MKHLVTLIPTFLALALVLSAAPSQAQCVRFDGFQHCPIGDADLQLSPDGAQLGVLGLGSEGNDGVSSHLGSSVLWQARLRIDDVAVGDELAMASMADGFPSSLIRYLVVDGGYQMTPRFTGGLGNFSLHLFDDGEEVPEGPGGLVPGTRIDIEFLEIEFPPIITVPDDETETDTGFGNTTRDASTVANRTISSLQPTEGACFWQAAFNSRVRVRVNGKVVGEGDEIIMLEDVNGGSGQYPYKGFEAMRLLSNGKALVISQEISNGF